MVHANWLPHGKLAKLALKFQIVDLKLCDRLPYYWETGKCLAELGILGNYKNRYR